MILFPIWEICIYKPGDSMVPLQRHLLYWVINYMQFQLRCDAELYPKKIKNPFGFVNFEF